jgi:Protein of unknown function (DUF3667)
MSDESLIILDSMADMLEPQCPNCNAPAHGAYCHQCGQKLRTPHDYRLLHFMKHALHEFTDIDSKILRSFRYLLFSPGKLTAEWRAGREGSFVKPVRLFIVVNIIYFIFLHFFSINTIVVPLDSQYSQQIYSRTIRPIVDEQIQASHTTFKKFAEKYDEISSEQAKTLVILMVPIFAAILAILYYRKHLYFVEHIVFSLHFYSLFLLLISVGALIMNLLVVTGFRVFGLQINAYEINWDELITLSDGTLILLYFIFALGKVYGGKLWANIIRASFLTYSLLYILWLYRFILFFTTIYTMPTKF